MRGRFVEEKRPDLAIRALEVVSQKYPNARLVFAGSTIPYEKTWERQQALVKQYRDQLIFLGLLPDPQDMANFYAACDVLVLPATANVSRWCRSRRCCAARRSWRPTSPAGASRCAKPGWASWRARATGSRLARRWWTCYDHPEQYRKPREFIEQKFSFQETVDRYENQFRSYATTAGRTLSAKPTLIPR